ncbi:MAG: hypothetical protein ACM3S1_08655 [Hyphomicrobiales bacterium]
MIHPLAEIYVNEVLATLHEARIEEPHRRRFPSLADAVRAWRPAMRAAAEALPSSRAARAAR